SCGGLERRVRKGSALRICAGPPGALSETLGRLPRLRPPAGPFPGDSFGLRRSLHPPAASAECQQSDGSGNRRDAVHGVPQKTPRRNGAVLARVAWGERSVRCRGPLVPILAVHPVQDRLLAPGEEGGVLDRIVPPWRGEQRSEQGRLVLCQFGGRLVKVMARRRLGAEDPI